LEKRNTKWKKPIIKHNVLTEWNWMVGYPDSLKLGMNVDIGAFTYINARYGVDIGDYVQIGANCSIYSHNTINNTHDPVKIEKYAKIGSHTTILPGVIIKENTLIKAGSVVYRVGDIIYVKTPTLYSNIQTLLGDDLEYNG